MDQMGFDLDTPREKRCIVCGEVKPLTEYYKHPTSRNGIRRDCAVCVCAKTNRYSKTERGIATSRRTIAKRIKAQSVKFSQAWAKKQAARFTTTARKLGHIPDPNEAPCSAGLPNCRGRHEWHHDSYRWEDWSRVRCLCSSHHKRWHQRNKPKPFDQEGYQPNKKRQRASG